MKNYISAYCVVILLMVIAVRIIITILFQSYIVSDQNIITDAIDNNLIHHIKRNRNRNRSCLNDIYDEIFLISSPNRHSTLSITIYQLIHEHISFTLWECHSPNNPYSVNLYNQFRENINKTSWINTWYQYDINEISAYHVPTIFYLRQTQIDILKYSQKMNFGKILILEDDILLSNTIWFEKFCEVESNIPFYFTLNIGVNTRKAFHYRDGGGLEYKLLNITGMEHSDIKYLLKNTKSYGAYAMAITNSMFEILINMFNFNQSIDNLTVIQVYPMDNHLKFVNETVREHSFNIHPNLILPDVTKSSIRSGKHEKWFVTLSTTDGNVTRYSKYWNLRFAENTSKVNMIQQQISDMTPSFRELMNSQSVSPSNIYLRYNVSI